MLWGAIGTIWIVSNWIWIGNLAANLARALHMYKQGIPDGFIVIGFGWLRFDPRVNSEYHYSGMNRPIAWSAMLLGPILLPVIILLSIFIPIALSYVCLHERYLYSSSWKEFHPYRTLLLIVTAGLVGTISFFLFVHAPQILIFLLILLSIAVAVVSHRYPRKLLPWLWEELLIPLSYLCFGFLIGLGVLAVLTMLFVLSPLTAACIIWLILKNNWHPAPMLFTNPCKVGAENA